MYSFFFGSVNWSLYGQRSIYTFFAGIKMNIGKSETGVGEFPIEFTSFDCFIPPSKYEELKEQIKHLEISERDVWICSFPRSGNQSINQVLVIYVENYQ
jgi:hypothetical protein